MLLQSKNENKLLLYEGDRMLELKKGQKAKAIADYLSSEPHGFEDGTEITFVKSIEGFYNPYTVYIFKGLVDGKMLEYVLTKSDFEIEIMNDHK
jgi:hypothetical protein